MLPSYKNFSRTIQRTLVNQDAELHPDNNMENCQEMRSI